MLPDQQLETIIGEPATDAYQEIHNFVNILNTNYLSLSKEPENDNFNLERTIIEKARTARSQFNKIFREKTQNRPELNETVFPNRGTEIQTPLDEIEFGCLNRIPPERMNSNEVGPFLTFLVEEYFKKGIEYDDYMSGMMVSHEGGYYYIKSIMDTIRNKATNGSRLVEQVVFDKTAEKILTESELTEVIDYEKGIFKLHVNIPRKHRLDFIKQLIYENGRSMKIGIDLQDKKGEETIISPEEKYAAGAILMGLGTWKFRGFSALTELDQITSDIDGNRLPDFVFYSKNPNPEIAKKLHERLKKGLSKIVRGYEDSDAPVPRFSTLIVGEDGYHHPSLSEAQGDGDFKLYLKRQGILDQYYTKESNYALMNS